jgi:hypothetical protein
MIQPTALTTLLINKLIPKCAINWVPTAKGIAYLHPRKGWKFVSWKRLGVIPQ